MIYTPPATLIDKPSALNLQGFVGNDLIVRLNVLGDAAMPDTVDCIAYYSGGGRMLPDAQQPAVSVNGRQVVIHFAGSDHYPFTAWHKILWNGRAVLSGDLAFSRDANRAGPTTNSLNVTVADGQIVNVSVLVGASAGGGSLLPDLQLAITSNGQIRWNIGGGEQRKSLFFNGVKMTRNIDYRITLPYLDWLSPVPIDTSDELVLTN